MAAAERVIDVRVFLPEDWWVIPLTDDAAMRASVRDLVHRQFTGIEDHPVLQSDLRRALFAQAEEAAGNGARLLALSLQQVDGVPVPASLVLTWINLPGEPAARGTTLIDLRDRLHPDPSQPLPPGCSLDLGKMSPGDVVRRVHVQASPEDASHNPHVANVDTLHSLVADYWLERPDLRGLVHLAFSSPMLPLRDSWLALWDAVVGALRWLGEEAAPSSERATTHTRQ